MPKPFFFLTALIGLAIIGSVLAAQSETGISLPSGYRHWFHVNAMAINDSSPLYEQLGGMHSVSINSVGLPALRKGGPYPDGTIFVDDVHYICIRHGRYVESDRKALAVMVKNSKKYALTGGWGFQWWAWGDPKKPKVTDATKQCFDCHTFRKDYDYVYSTYIP